MFIKDQSRGVVEKRSNVSQAIFSNFIGGTHYMPCKINKSNNRVISLLSRIMSVSTQRIQKTGTCGCSGESDCLWKVKALIFHFRLFYNSGVSKLWSTSWLPSHINTVLLEHSHTHLNKKSMPQLYAIQSKCTLNIKSYMG